MKSKRIKNLFDKIYKYPNPIFCFPILYFQHGNYYCELAQAHKNLLGWTKWRNESFTNSNPLLIFEGLFVDDGIWCTVLERKNDVFIERHDLNGHINNINELNRFIWTNLS